MSSPFPFPETIDSSARATFAACPRQFFYAYTMRKSRIGLSPHLLFGGALARGLEATRLAFYLHHKSVDASLSEGLAALIAHWAEETRDAPSDHETKSLDNCGRALVSYFSQYPLDSDPYRPHIIAQDEIGVEFTFAIPIPDIFHPVSGLPILYTGRFDMLAERDGLFFIEDDKTTGQLGMNFATSMKMRSQFTGYTWAAQQYGFHISGVLIRAIAIQKTGIKHLEIIEQRPKFFVDRWLFQLQQDIKSMIRMWEADYWDFNLDDACTSYGGCQFLDVCCSPSPDRMLSAFYKENTWDPLA